MVQITKSEKIILQKYLAPLVNMHFQVFYGGYDYGIFVQNTTTKSYMAETSVGKAALQFIKHHADRAEMLLHNQDKNDIESFCLDCIGHIKAVCHVEYFK